MMKLPLNTDLSGKVAVVTGAGGVLCGMFAQALAQAGAKVAVLDLNEEAAQKVADEIVAEGGVAKAYKTNVLEKDSLIATHEAVVADLGTAISLSTAQAETTHVLLQTRNTSSMVISTLIQFLSSTWIQAE